MRLKDKIALVTGASRGIGYASCLALAKEGATIVGTARTAKDLEALEKAVAAAGGKVKTFTADITKSADVAACVKQTVDAFGRIDILVNNAGIGGYRPFLDWTEEDYDRIMTTNATWKTPLSTSSSTGCTRTATSSADGAIGRRCHRRPPRRKTMIRKSLWAIVLATVYSQAHAVDIEEGQHLFLFTQTPAGGCLDCHGEDHFADADRRKADTLHTLSGWVQGCNLQFDVGWFPEEEDSVTAFLNQRFYQFDNE